MRPAAEQAYSDVLAVAQRLDLPVPLVLHYYTWGGVSDFKESEGMPVLTDAQRDGLVAARRAAPGGFSRLNRDCLVFYTADEAVLWAVDRLAAIGRGDQPLDELDQLFRASSVNRLVSIPVVLRRIQSVLVRTWCLPEADAHSRGHLRTLRGVFQRYAEAYRHDFRFDEFPVWIRA